ncbi:MAG: hypothetical protein IJE07_08930 [Clostridia bacterium]|nr:hypothetical protein [Clostridia bacterium]
MQTAPNPRPRYGRIAAIVLAALLVLSVLALALTPVIAPLFLYLPTHDAQAREALLAREDVESLTVESGDAVLSGYFLRGAEGAAPVILYFNGNHENASAFMQELVSTPERLAAFSGCHFAQLDYPSYGLSGGKPGADAYRAMALDVYDALAAREDVTEVIVLGYSIGTGPAHYCAANRPVSGLILLAPYASGTDLFNNIVPVFHGPLEALVCYDMPSIAYAADVTVQPLVFATPEDHLVPYESTLRLTETYPAGCTFVTVPDIDHKGFLKTPMVLEAISTHIAAITAQGD